MVEEKLVELRIDGQVADISLHQEKKLNALSAQLLEDLDAAIEAVAANLDVRAVLVRGEGRAFAAGADISAMAKMRALEAQRYAARAQGIFTKLEHLPQVTLALVQGYALGGGNELAMACDLRLAAEGTKFGQPEVMLGILPSFGGTQRLARIVGEGRALNLILTGAQIDAAEAYRIGLVNEVVPADQLDRRGTELAEKLAKIAPHALAVAKQSVYNGEDVSLSRGLAQEAALFGLCFATADQKEGMGAFLEHRQARFTGK